MSHRPLFALLVLPAIALLHAGCGSDEPSAPAPTSTPAQEPTLGAAATPTAAPALDSTPALTPERALVDSAPPARQRLDWFVAALNSPEPPSAAEIEAQFSPNFLAQIAPEQLLQGAAQMTAMVEPPLTIESVTPTAADGTTLEAVLVSADGTARLSVALATSAQEPHLIEGLVGVPDLALEFPSGLTEAQLDATLASLGSSSAVGVYDVTNGDCTAIHEIRADDALVLGSAFKLWVLAELADRIAADEVAWDDTVVVDDRYKSSPDGEVFSIPAGTEMTVQELALLMISISDNSATDHLIAHLRRDRIEAALERIGMTSRDANLPLLSTSALFQLKFVADDPSSVDYRNLDETARRALLEELDDAVLPWVLDPDALDLVNADGVPIDQPRDLDIEWFATPLDLCRTLAYLAELAEQPGLEPLAGIMEANAGAGLPFDRDRWPTIRFKGGSEPGVIAGAWWFENADGRRFVVAGGISDPDEPIDEISASVALASAITLVD